MTSVLRNFLGTFTSRYSDYRGYWLFGLLPAEFERFSVGLLADPPEGDGALQVMQRLAIRRFGEQLMKSRLDRSVVREAVLELTRDSKPVLGWQGDFKVQGRSMGFLVRVAMDTGRKFEEQQSVFVAAHDPSKERRRDLSDWGT